MKLRKPPHPDPVGSAAYYFIQAAHRDTAITLAVDVLRDAYERDIDATPNDDFGAEASAIARDWAIETLIQGAWMREFHMWELATKAYFKGQHARNGGAVFKWSKAPPRAGASHVEKVSAQLDLFGASVPKTIIDAMDSVRAQVNVAKHQDEIFVTETEYRDLISAVAAFWDTLADQEAFTPPARAAPPS